MSTHHRLRAGDRVLELGVRPLLMGVVNASPDSFSDGGRYGEERQRVALAAKLVADGADILDVGGESASTGRPAVQVQEEIERVVPLIEGIVAELDRMAAETDSTAIAELDQMAAESDSTTSEGGVGGRGGRQRPVISVDTYKPAVARAAIAAGASIVNDVSGLRDPELADICAQTGAALVVMHTRAAPKQRLQDPDLYGDIVGDVLGFLEERVRVAGERGVEREQLLLDPGPDFAKTPAQTIELLSQVERLHELGLPLLMAISRKDFIGALTHRPPRERLGGTLAAFDHGVRAGAHIFRLHDIAAAADFLRVRSALSGEELPRRDLALAEEHRYERPRE